MSVEVRRREGKCQWILQLNSVAQVKYHLTCVVSTETQDTFRLWRNFILRHETDAEMEGVLSQKIYTGIDSGRAALFPSAKKECTSSISASKISSSLTFLTTLSPR